MFLQTISHSHGKQMKLTAPQYMKRPHIKMYLYLTFNQGHVNDCLYGGLQWWMEVNGLHSLPEVSLSHLHFPCWFSTFSGADQLFNWHDNVINCFLVIGPAEFYTVKKYKSGVYLQAIKRSRTKVTYKRCPAVQSNWFCFISCVSLVESTNF